MKTNLSKKLLALLLALMCLVTSIPFSVGAESVNGSGVDVEIVSFMRGKQDNLRASELLEARVTGYKGNVQNLTYKWTNNLGTYLYVYNSHNMYYINNTDGEIEIFNDKVASSENMVGRSFKDSYSRQGFCWAAVYGSFTSGTRKSISSTTAFVGTITVEVYDGATLLAKDTHEGKRVWVSNGNGWWGGSYQQQGIISSSLESDMDDVTIGIFEGDKRNVKDLLGESAILHITCSESTVQDGEIKEGKDNITLTGNATDDYYITANTLVGEGSTSAEGDAQVELTIKKNTCKFHEKTTATATTTVYVFKKPTTSTTAYTLTLTGNLDKRCTYYIGGQKGVLQTVDGKEIVVFTGLTPNTDYQVEVRGTYTDENNVRTAYAYVYDKTKPVYNGTVEVYLNGTYDSATHTASGNKVDLETVSGSSTLYAKNIDGTEYIELVKKDTGVYSSILDTGSYKLYYGKNEASKIDDQLLTMHNADRTRYLFYNSVQYKDGDTDLGTDYYLTDSKVTTRIALENKNDEKKVFTGWMDQYENSYPADAVLTEGISQEYVLTAQWEDGVDVYVNFTIDHKDKNSGAVYLEDQDRHNVVFDLMSRDKALTSGNFSDVFTSSSEIKWNGTEAFNVDGYALKTEKDGEIITQTKYNATKPILTNVLNNKDYSVEVIKSGYEIREVKVDDTESGKIVINVSLQYEAKNGDLRFEVKLDEKAQTLVKEHPEYKPVAVNVKVLSWYTSNRNEIKANTWEHITQHHDTFVTLYLNDDLTEASGSYPVWMRSNSDVPFYYRIKVVSYVLPNGRVLETEDTKDKSMDGIQYISEGGRYLATISADGGKSPNNELTKLLGAYFDKQNVQQGELVATISIQTHNVTFVPNKKDETGATLNGSAEELKLTQQIKVPNLEDYVPVKDGGYVFDGWYLENGTKVTSGEELTGDITLYAHWKAPLTVKGTVFVAGYYYLDENNTNEPTVIYENDRTHAVTVNLQRILPNSYTETIKTTKVSVAYDNEAEKPMGKAEYSFTEVPDDGHQYRILIQNPNYVVTYQNEPDSIDPEKVTQYKSSYNSTDFNAIFGESNDVVADVNAFMRFSPENFNLHYQVNAFAINKDYRPAETEILIHGNDGKNGITPQNWPVIAQMNNSGEKKGQDVTLKADGTSDIKSYEVWKYQPDGHSLYDYGVSLNSYTYNSNGEKIPKVFDPVKAPFFVYYNGDARYSAKEGLSPEHQTQLLTVTLAPKRYIVNFDMNFTETNSDYVSDFKFTVTPKVEHGTDENGQLVIVYNETPVHETSHIWSYETDLSDAIPTRQGYKFLGWFDGEGEEAKQVTKIDALTDKDVTLYAKWEPLFTVTFHNNLEHINEDVFRVYYEKGDNHEGVLTLTENGKVEQFYAIPKLNDPLNNHFIFKGWYLQDGTPISWDDVYTGHTDIYAHWIEVNEIDKDGTDTKILPYPENKYPEFDLAGVQIREEINDPGKHDGTASSGLRFVSVLSDNVYNQINEIKNKEGQITNSNKAEYGYVLAKSETVIEKSNGDVNYKLQYKGENVNGVDTNTEYNYVDNIRCSGYDDHRIFDGKYRLYTVVITYDGITGEDLEMAHDMEVTARAYLRYTDANGLLRTYYNNYTGTSSFGGCSASYNMASASLEIERHEN